MSYPLLKFTLKSKIQVANVSLTLKALCDLEPICVSGLPNKLPEEMREALEELVCLALNPLRPSIQIAREHMEGD